MNLPTPSQSPGAQSLPAELRTRPGGNFTQRRLWANATGLHSQQRNLRGFAGLSGLGDDPASVDLSSYWDSIGIDPSTVVSPELDLTTYDYGYNPTTVPAWATDPSYGGAVSPGANITHPAPNITTILDASGKMLAQITALTKPGTYLKTFPDGTTVAYSQPTGATQNLPGVYGAAGGPSGSFSSPLGSGSVAGFSAGSLGLWAAIGLLGLLALKGGK